MSLILARHRSPRGFASQAGFSLVELMIAVVLGMIVIAGVIQVFVGSATSNTELLRMTRLEEELSSILTLMSADIRRAGYNTDADDQGTVASGWVNAMAPVNVNADADCILYTYDATGGGNADAGLPANQFGFRLNGTTVEMFDNQAGGNWDCAGGAGWVAASSANVIDISDLDFQLTAQCLNVTNAALGCGGAQPLDTLVTTRIVDITLSGELAADALVDRTLQESVRIRNDLVTFVPNAAGPGPGGP